MGELETDTGTRPRLGTVAPPLMYVCPRCKGTLSTVAGDGDIDFHYVCGTCGVDYPVILGIPDFRIFPDPWIGMEADRAKGGRLAARSDDLDVAGLVEYYWQLTPNTPPELARRYARHAAGAVERGLGTLAEIERMTGEMSTDGPFLDVGCGTGGLLVAAAERFDRVVGVDIAFRWLVVARKRLIEAGRSDDVSLVCCCGEALPFPEQTFAVAVASQVLEHTATQEAFLREGLKALRPGGVFFLSTPNRLALGPEPHVQVWGVGYLPRWLMPAWVRLNRGVSYRYHRLLSVFEIRRLLRRAGASDYRVVLPRIGAADLARYGRWERRGALLYNRLLVFPPARWVFYLAGPFFHVLAWARPLGENRTRRA